MFLLLIQLLLRQYGSVKTSSGLEFDYSIQLHSHTFKGLGNLDHIEKFALCTGHIGLRAKPI